MNIEGRTDKQSIAIKVIDSIDNNIIISLQVINELSNILLRKFKLNPPDVENVILELDSTFDIVNFDIATQIKALKLNIIFSIMILLLLLLQ